MFFAITVAGLTTVPTRPPFPEFDPKLPVVGELVTARMDFDSEGKIFSPIEQRIVYAVTVFGQEVHANYITDGASNPARAAYFVIDPYGPGFAAALLHDLRYSERIFPAWPEPYDLRLWADDEFERNLRACGFNFVRRRAARRAVRLFGGRIWARRDQAPVFIETPARGAA